MLRPSRRRSRSPRPAGFTVIELMISLVIIGIMAMAVAPSLSELLADNRQSSAAWEIVRLARRARAFATATGTAQLLRIRTSGDAVGGNGHGTIFVYAGMNNKCAQTPWATAMTDTFDATTGQGPREIFSMLDFNPGRGSAAPTKGDLDRQVIYFEPRFGDATAALETNGVLICYQPNGEIYTADNAAAGTPLAIQTESMLLSVLRSVNGVARGVAGGRQVLFPIGGNARLR